MQLISNEVFIAIWMMICWLWEINNLCILTDVIFFPSAFILIRVLMPHFSLRINQHSTAQLVPHQIRCRISMLGCIINSLQCVASRYQTCSSGSAHAKHFTFSCVIVMLSLHFEVWVSLPFPFIKTPNLLHILISAGQESREHCTN